MLWPQMEEDTYIPTTRRLTFLLIGFLIVSLVASCSAEVKTPGGTTVGVTASTEPGDAITVKEAPEPTATELTVP